MDETKNDRPSATIDELLLHADDTWQYEVGKYVTDLEEAIQMQSMAMDLAKTLMETVLGPSLERSKKELAAATLKAKSDSARIAQLTEQRDKARAQAEQLDIACSGQVAVASSYEQQLANVIKERDQLKEELEISKGNEAVSITDQLTNDLDDITESFDEPHTSFDDRVCLVPHTIAGALIARGYRKVI